MNQPTSPAIHTQQVALRNAYAAGDPERCAAHHLNLANHLEHAGAGPTTILAHRLAGGVLCFQSSSDLLPGAVGALAISFAAAAPAQPPLPSSYEELCAIVETVDGVHFAEVIAALGQDGGADGDEAMHAVAGMARFMAR
jgi:hypothetical protein